MNPKSPIISVIIPVYNSEKYLQKCLNSIILQTYSNLDIICVNDGSTDSSLKILESFAKKDPRIRIFSQKNNGQSSARNLGLKEARGEYISFIDSDDWLSLSCYSKFIRALNETSEPFDIYNFNGILYSESPNIACDNSLFIKMSNWKSKTKNTHLYKFSDCTSPFYGNISICNKIYSSKFLKDNNITFMLNTIYEDNIFHFATFIHAKNIYINNDILYHYCQNESSTTHTLNKNAFDIFNVINCLKNLLKENNVYENNKYALLQFAYKHHAYSLFIIDDSYQKAFYTKAVSCLKDEINTLGNLHIINQLVDVHILYNFINLSCDKFITKYKPYLLKQSQVL